MTWYQSMGHKRSVWTPRCIRAERARTQLLFYSKHHAINVNRERTKLIVRRYQMNTHSLLLRVLHGENALLQYWTELCSLLRKGNTREACGRIRRSVRRISTARTCGHGVVYCLQTFVVRIGLGI